MELFDFIDALFCQIKWKSVTDDSKYKYSYMTNRFLSIRYPIEINNSQVVGLGKKNTARMMDFWHHVLIRHYKTQPNWLRTKSGTKPKIVDVLKSFEKTLISNYCNHHQLDTKTLAGLCEYFPKEVKADMKAFGTKDLLKKTTKKAKKA